MKAYVDLHTCSLILGLLNSVQGNAELQPDPLNVHRLLLTGVLLAAKLMDDRYYSNAYYAKVGLRFHKAAWRLCICNYLGRYVNRSSCRQQCTGFSVYK